MAIGMGLAIGFVLTQDDDDADQTAVEAQPSAEATEEPPEPSATPDPTEVPEDEGPEPTEEPATESTPVPTPESTSAGSFDISDEMIEAAIAEAAANPAEEPVLADRNDLATAAFNNEFAGSGFDLSGVDEEGPFVMTITLLFTDLEEAVAGTVDVFDRASVQLERG